MENKKLVVIQHICGFCVSEWEDSQMSSGSGSGEDVGSKMN